MAKRKQRPASGPLLFGGGTAVEAPPPPAGVGLSAASWGPAWPRRRWSRSDWLASAFRSASPRAPRQTSGADRRHFHQAQARRRISRRTRGYPHSGRPRPWRGDARSRGDRSRALRQGNRPDEVKRDPSRRGRAGAPPGRPAARHRREQAAVRHPGGRRQRLRQDRPLSASLPRSSQPTAAG